MATYWLYYIKKSALKELDLPPQYLHNDRLYAYTNNTEIRERFERDRDLSNMFNVKKRDLTIREVRELAENFPNGELELKKLLSSGISVEMAITRYENMEVTSAVYSLLIQSLLSEMKYAVEMFSEEYREALTKLQYADACDYHKGKVDINVFKIDVLQVFVDLYYKMLR